MRRNYKQWKYGTFPKVIGHFVRECGVMPLAEAVRKITSLPAQTLRLKERGIIREGLHADLTIYDRNTFANKSTFPNSHPYSQGLMYVIVNEKLVVKKGKHPGGLPGMVLYGYGKDLGERK